MNTSVVLFKDEEGNVDFGLSIPDHGLLFVFVVAVCLILTMLKFCTISTMFITLSRRSHLAAFMMNYLITSKLSTLAQNNLDPLRRVFILCVVSHI